MSGFLNVCILSSLLSWITLLCNSHMSKKGIIIFPAQFWSCTVILDSSQHFYIAWFFNASWFMRIFELIEETFGFRSLWKTNFFVDRGSFFSFKANSQLCPVP
jgi:hypothetical protein